MLGWLSLFWAAREPRSFRVCNYNSVAMQRLPTPWDGKKAISRMRRLQFILGVSADLSGLRALYKYR